MVAYYTHMVSALFFFLAYQYVVEPVPDCQIKAAWFYLLEKQFLRRQQTVALPGAAGASLEPK